MKTQIDVKFAPEKENLIDLTDAAPGWYILPAGPGKAYPHTHFSDRLVHKDVLGVLTWFYNNDEHPLYKRTIISGTNYRSAHYMAKKAPIGTSVTLTVQE